MEIQLLKPSEAPAGVMRLLGILQASLAIPEYNKCQMVVAFARLSGIVRLLPQIRAWRSRGHSVEAVVGIDRFGTSIEALQVMLEELDSVYIAHTTDPACTFHPKMYLFEGDSRARAIVGSHNLTSGGLETNFEGSVIVDMQLPEEASQWKPFLDSWDQLLPGANPCSRKLDTAFLRKLIAAGQLLPELKIAQVAHAVALKEPTSATPARGFLPAIRPVPPSPIPKGLLPGLPHSKAGKKKPAKSLAVERPSTVEGLPRALIIEIVPHHNGEIFLSKKAADAFPTFFGMPFTGKTVPKKAGNPACPMRTPDPLVEWRLYDKRGNLSHHSKFSMNTVLYLKKSEIRITVAPSLAKAMPHYSVMVMWGGSSPLPADVDYVVDVFVPGSPGELKWGPVMNVTLPGGGEKRPRRMGWV